MYHNHIPKHTEAACLYGERNPKCSPGHLQKSGGGFDTNFDVGGYNEERTSKDLRLRYNQALLTSLLHPAGRESEAWKKHTACYASWLMQGLGKQEAGKGEG